jgi:hypothetical protein
VHVSDGRAAGAESTICKAIAEAFTIGRSARVDRVKLQRRSSYFNLMLPGGNVAICVWV